MSAWSQFLLGIFVGGIVSIPLGPFGIWALHVYMREGWGAAIAVALGGVVGDLLILFAYLFGGYIAQQYFSTNLEELIRISVGNGLVRGIAACAIGIFLVVTACREHIPNSKMGRFGMSFAGAINPLNVPAVGFIFAKFGIQDMSAGGHFLSIATGFAFGSFFTWVSCMWAFSHLHFLRMTIKLVVLDWEFERPILTFILFGLGFIFLFVGAGFLLHQIH